MKGLILAAHGSKKITSNQEIVKLSEQVSNSLSMDFDFVDVGFLELATPKLPELLVDMILSKSVDEITIFPYFLAAGVHVSQDLPEIISDVQLRYPAVKINVLPHIGSTEFMSNYICDFLKTSSSCT